MPPSAGCEPRQASTCLEDRQAAASSARRPGDRRLPCAHRHSAPVRRAATCCPTADLSSVVRPADRPEVSSWDRELEDGRFRPVDGLYRLGRQNSGARFHRPAEPRLTAECPASTALVLAAASETDSGTAAKSAHSAPKPGQSAVIVQLPVAGVRRADRLAPRSEIATAIGSCGSRLCLRKTNQQQSTNR
ncbi:hypothetical protein D3C87_1361300 [compost metagenome]